MAEKRTWDTLTKDAKRLIIEEVEKWEKKELDLMRREVAILREDTSWDVDPNERITKMAYLIRAHNKRRRRNIKTLMQGSKFKSLPKS